MVAWPNVAAATRNAPATSGQPLTVEHGPPQPPGVPDCDAVDLATMRIPALTHTPWVALTLVVAADVEVTTTHLPPPAGDVALPAPSAACDGTVWHQTTGACMRGSDCPSGTCDAAGRCACSAGGQCCSGSCTAGICDLAALTVPSTQHNSALILLRCGDPGCTQGDVVAMDGDGRAATEDPRDARIALTALAAGSYRVVAYSAALGQATVAELAVLVGGVAVHQQAHIVGGMYGGGRELRPLDSVLVGKDNDGRGMPFVPGQPDDAHHDTRAWLFEQTFVGACTPAQGCGRFRFNEDAFLGNDRPLRLSRVALPADWSAPQGSALLGASSAATPAVWINARVMHHRRHVSEGGSWQGACHLDRDQDGLTAEIEWELGSCDDASSDVPLAVGIAGRSCLAYKDFVESFTPGCPMPGGGSHPDCWSARDSDNDGLEDGWEVFGVAFSCSFAPTGPAGEVGACLPLSIHAGACPQGQHCLTEALSARDDPHPTVYDVFVQSVAARCGPAGVTAKDQTCRDDHAALTATNDGDEHGVSLAQRLRLAQTFTVDAATCADGGSAFADGTVTCAGDALGDLRYFVNLHVAPVDDRDLLDAIEPAVLEVPDDTWRQETIGQIHIAVSLVATRFAGALRHGGLARLGYASHTGGGEAQWLMPLFYWPNTFQDVGASATLFAHEVGHTLGLLHPFDQSEQPQPWSVDVTTCTNLTPLCQAPLDGMTDNRDAPHVDSLMSATYSLAGMRARGAGAPAPGSAAYGGCAWTNDHFSKGYNFPIGEAGVNETLFLDPVNEFRQRALVSSLACYFPLGGVDVGTCPNPVGQNQAYGFPPGAGAPFCGATTCSVNWDGQGQFASPNQYAWEVNYASNGAPNACAQDVLVDRNDFGILMGFGKQTLVKARSGGALVRHGAIYAATFNRSDPANVAGWSDAQLPVSAQGTYAAQVFRVNSCTGDGDCPAFGVPVTPGKCLDDSCTANAHCLAGCDVAAGRCSCLNGADCLSGVCDAGTGLCVVAELGACECSQPIDCHSVGGIPPVGVAVTCSQLGSIGPFRCGPTNFSGAIGPNIGAEARYREALQIQAPSADELRLSRDGTSATNALALIGAGGFPTTSVTLRFDFMWAGFEAGQNTATLLASSMMRFDFQRDPNGNPVAVFTPSGIDTGGVATPLDPVEIDQSEFAWRANRWYRLAIVIDRSDPMTTRLRYNVWSWHPFRGQFEPSLCFERPLPPYTLAAVNDVVFGWDGVVAASHTSMVLDNVSLLATIDYTGFDVSSCVVLP